MGAAQTALAKLALGTADPVDTGIAFRDFDPGVSKEIRDTTGTRGSFFSDANRNIPTRVGCEPRLSCEPSVTELVYLMPWILGGAPTGTTTKTFPFSNTAALRNIHFKPNAGEEWFLSDVGVDTATFRASTGEPLELDLDCLGRVPDATRTDFPGGITYDLTTQPWIMSHLALTVGGVSRTCREFTWTVKNGLDRTRFLNSLTLTAVNKVSPDGVYMFGIEVPSGDNGSQFWAAGVAGASLVATFTNYSNSVLTITAANVNFQPRSPNFPQGGEAFLRLEGKATRTSTSDPVTVTITP